MRVNCERSVRCTRQTWDHSSQAARRRLIGFMKTNQTDRFPENSCPLATRFAPLSRHRQITPVRRAKIWWGNSLLSCMPSSFHGLQKHGPSKIGFATCWLTRIFLLISAWNRLKNEVKKHIFLSMFSPYFNCYCLHPVLIYRQLFWRLIVPAEQITQCV